MKGWVPDFAMRDHLTIVDDMSRFVSIRRRIFPEAVENRGAR